MTKYYEYEEHIRRVPRDRSPDYYSGGASRDDDNPRSSKDSFKREVLTLEPPPGSSHSRPRSVPPPDRQVVARGRSPSPPDDYYYDSRDASPSRRRTPSRERSESPMSRARGVVEDNFTRSTTGIGASLLGAVAGGWAARQAGEQLARRRRAQASGGRQRRRSDADKDDDKIRLASTLLGAAIGGLGANAIANRFEDSRDRTRAHQDAWEDRWGPEEGLPHYDTGRRGDLDHRGGRGLIEPGRDEYDDEDDYVYDKKRRDDRLDDRFDDRRDDRRDDPRYDDRRYGDRRDEGRYDDRRYNDRYDDRTYDDRY